jgi:3-deoxy-manno-octulosonate cytidylyltransferase (CMP-KDO synthetase)
VLPVSFRELLSRTSQPPHTVVIIPARFDATRLPGKPLADICGIPMIVHVYRSAAATAGIDAVVVATDDERVVRAVEDSGGVACLTSPAHRTGTDRVAEVAAALDCQIVINLQGDEPLIHPDMIRATVEPLLRDSALNMSTVCRAIDEQDDYLNPNVVKVVRNTQGMALYFSRSPIPHLRGPRPVLWKHFGLYGYRKAFLLQLSRMTPTPLEQAESLEQLRVLEHGFGIYTALTEHDSIGVDTPEDLDRARRLMSTRPPHLAANLGSGDRAHI